MSTTKGDKRDDSAGSGASDGTSSTSVGPGSGGASKKAPAKLHVSVAVETDAGDGGDEGASRNRSDNRNRSHSGYSGYSEDGSLGDARDDDEEEDERVHGGGGGRSRTRGRGAGTEALAGDEPLLATPQVSHARPPRPHSSSPKGRQQMDIPLQQPHRQPRQAPASAFAVEHAQLQQRQQQQHRPRQQQEQEQEQEQEQQRPPQRVFPLGRDPNYHRYRVAVDLRSVRDLESTSRVYLRYTYPLFGSSAPVQTRPPVDVDRQTEALLDNGFCAFEFVLTETQLASSFQEDPLVVEVMHVDQFSADQEIGIVKLNLAGLLTATPHASNDTILRVVDNYSTIYSLETAEEAIKQNPKIVRRGAIRAVLSLEDFGVYHGVPPPQLHGQQEQLLQKQQQQQLLQQQQQSQPHFQVAWELELWKQAEEVKFEATLQRRLDAKMRELEKEWKEQELKREQLLAKRQRDIARLEKQYKQAMFDIEQQQTRLSLREAELEKRALQMERDFEQEKHEVLLTVRRLREQHKHKLALVERKAADFSKENDVLKSRAAEAEARYEEVAAELRQQRHRSTKSSTGQMRNAMDDLERENEELADKLRNQIDANNKLKTQLKQALREVARQRKRRQEDEERRLQEERLELLRLRSQMVAREHQGGMHRDQIELEGIKEDLKRLLTAPSLKFHRGPPPDLMADIIGWGGSAGGAGGGGDVFGGSDGVPFLGGGGGGGGGGAAANNPELERLIAEREALLRDSSGTYHKSHPLIQGLNGRIAGLRSAASPRDA